MPWPVLSNAYEILDLTPGASPRAIRRRAAELAACLGAGAAGVIRDAADRLLDPFQRGLETVFSTRSGRPMCCEATAALRAVLAGVADCAAINAAHESWKRLLVERRLDAELSPLMPGILPWRRRAQAREVARRVPGTILLAQAERGRQALEAGAGDAARTHARAIAGSPLGDAGERAAALAAMFGSDFREAGERLDRASGDIEAILAVTPGAEAKRASGRAALDGGWADIAATLARVGEVSGEAAALIRDAGTRLERRLALGCGAAGLAPEQVAADLREAAARAGSAEQREEFLREAADPEWACQVEEAMSFARTGRPDAAWRRLRSLRRRTDRPERRAWVDRLRASPFHWIAPVRREPWRCRVFGCGVGFAGRRKFGEGGVFASSWGLSILGLQVLTHAVYLRRSAKLPVTIGRIPLKFRPSQVGAFLRLAAGLLLVLTAAAAGLEWWINKQDHLHLTVAQHAIEQGDLTEAANALGSLGDCDAPIVRFRHDRTWRAYLAAELSGIRTPEDAQEFLERIRRAGGDERTSSAGEPTSAPWPVTCPVGLARWIDGDSEARIVRCLSELPVTPLPSGGGAPWAPEVEPWDDEAVWTADFVSWAVQRCPGLWKRGEAFILEMARRFDTPHLWALAVDWRLSKVLPADPEITRRLGVFLETSRYGAWAKHYRMYAAVASAEDAERILNRRARGVWIGYDRSRELDSIKDLFPQPLRSLVEPGKPEGVAAALSHERRGMYELGVLYRQFQARESAAASSHDLAEIRRLLEEYPQLIRDVPEDDQLPEMYCIMLNFMGRASEVVEIAEGRDFPGRAGVLVPAYLKLGRLEDALRLLQEAAARSLPELRRMQIEWEAALQREAALRRKRPGEATPSGWEKERILRGDRGPETRTPEEWFRAAVYWSRPMARYRIRWMFQESRLLAVEDLAALWSALDVASGGRRPDLSERAVLLLAESSAWRGGDMRSEKPAAKLRCALILRRSTDPVAAISDPGARGDHEALACLAQIFRRAGVNGAALRCYEAAWECAPETGRKTYALAALGLAEDRQQQLFWVQRLGGRTAELATRAAKIPEFLEAGRWDEIAETAEAGLRIVGGLGQTNERRMGESAWHFVAWVAKGDEAHLERATEGARFSLSSAPSQPALVRLFMRILAAGADVAMSGGGLRADLLHGSMDLDWVSFAPHAPDAAVLTERARANADLAAAEQAARMILAQVPGDEEAVAALSLIALFRQDPAVIPEPAEPPDAGALPAAPTTEVPGELPPTAACPELSGGPTSMTLKMVERALESSELDPHSPSRACLLYRRALLNMALTEDGDEKTLDAAIRDLEESLFLRETSCARDALLLALAARGCGQLENPELWTPEAAVAARGTSVLGVAVRVSARPADAASYAGMDYFRRAAEIAAHRLDYADRPLSVEALAILRIVGHARVREAEDRPRREDVVLRIAIAAGRHRPADASRAYAYWLAVDALEGRAAAGKFAATSPLRAQFEALTKP